MTLPHPDRALEDPWESWPPAIPVPVVSREFDTTSVWVHDIYRATMPNGATAECWTIAGVPDEQSGSTGDWTHYGLVYNPEFDCLDGPGSAEMYYCLEQWLRQDRGAVCGECYNSGTVTTEVEERMADYLAGKPFREGERVTCPSCLGMGWIPHPPEDLL